MSELGDDFNLDNPADRHYFVKQLGFFGWCYAYLPHYFTVAPAAFHTYLAQSLADPKLELLEVIGFRGSAKSTFATLGLPLYLALEHLNNFIILASDTTTQTKLNIANIRYELETNPRLIEDYGQVFNSDTNWSQEKMLLTTGVFILGRSRGQKMRGLRHRQFRPQTVIVDDPEDLAWVQEKKNRDKTERWLKSEIIPGQEEDASKLIVIGNLLHKDALMMRLRKMKRADGTRLFKCLKFSLFKDGQCSWRGKYPTDEAIQKQKEKVGVTAWSREYLLKIVAEADQVIAEEDIHYYPNLLPDKRDDQGNKKHHPKDSGVGVDLAIGEKEKNDCTTMVAGIKLELDHKDHILIRPNPLNRRIDFDTTLTEAVKLNAVLTYGTKWYVEDKQYQRAALQGMKKKGLSVYPMVPVSNKRARLETVSPFIKDGTVMFPESGCEELIDQVVGFGTEEHDDLLDALVYLIMGMVRRRVFGAVERPDKI